MSKITIEDSRHLAALSNLDLSDEELEEMRGYIENVLGYVESLDELDTDGVEPTYQVTGLENIWRQDKVLNTLVGRDELIKLAPESMNGQVKVPKVL